MKIICLEGPHGSGKTEIINILSRLGYNTLDEGFTSMPKYSLQPQSFALEFLWVAKWMKRVLGEAEMMKLPRWRDYYTDNSVIFVDRSPFSILFYAPGGDVMEQTINNLVSDLELVDVEIITVYINVDDDKLWERVQKRLMLEPERSAYKESDKNWLQSAVDFYKSREWSATVSNNSNIDETISNLLALASSETF